jgi:hypothetical protein
VVVFSFLKKPEKSIVSKHNTDIFHWVWDGVWEGVWDRFWEGVWDRFWDRFWDSCD